jgi:cytochrome c biogenesis protein CcdA
MVLGGVSGFVGQVAQVTLGRYWKLFAGLVAVFLGLAGLRLLPFELGSGKAGPAGGRLARLGPALAGIVLGGMVAACSLPCNPGIFIVVGAAVLQGTVVWAILLLGMFATGFAIPLGAVMLGISMGRMTLAARGADAVVRWVTGLVLLVAGFYFLGTF